MIKHKGNYNKAIQELKNNTNNAVSFVYDNKALNTDNSLVLANAVYTIKDIFATKDAKTQGSSLSLLDFEPKYDAEAVKRLNQAGAIAAGKVHCDELALGGEGIYSHWGIIKNPLDPNRKAGGSSSGSVATLTENISFALASDTGDSVRLPASFIGTIGYKPSYGAISRYGMFAYASSLDTVSYFAHNVNDIIEISKVLYGVDKKDLTTVNIKMDYIKKTKPKNIAFFNLTKYIENSLVNTEYQKLIENLKNQNISVSILEPNVDLLKAVKPVYDIISFSEASSNLANINGIAFGNRVDGDNWKDIMINTRSDGFGKMVQRRLLLGSFFLNKENQELLFLRAQKIRRLIKNYLDDIYNKFDLLIFPSYDDVAPTFYDKKEPNFLKWILTSSNLVGNPSISIPWIKDAKQNNLPINISLDSKIYEDEKLLSYSLWIEEFLGVKND